MPSAIETFRTTHVYTADATLADVVRDLRAIQDLGQSIDARRAWYKKYFLILILPAILVGYIGLRFASDDPVPVLCFVIPIAGGCFLAMLGWIKYAGLWYELRLGALVDRTLATLSRDMAPAARISVRIDFRAHDHFAKLKREGQANQWKVKYYVDPWLKLTGRLLDGSVFRLAAITQLQKRTKWKKSRSGKSKMKSKSKEATIFSLRLRIKPRKYPRVEEITSAAQAVQLPQGATVRKVSTKADAVFLSARVSKWDNTAPSDKPASAVSAPHMVAMMFLSVYQIVKLSKAMAKAGR